MYGLYVHVPFCRQLCPYCDFAVAVRREPPHEAYGDALRAELEARRAEHPGAPHTVYFGGGTPSLWSTAVLARFLAEIDLDDAVEVTLEANPLDVTDEMVEQWGELGITRLSIGAQAFDDGALLGLGRDHGAAEARAATERALARGLSVSVDVIYGGPGYVPSVAEEVARIGPHHVSAYELTIEPNTVFGRRHAAGTLAMPEDDALADVAAALRERLAAAGYERYEVSSYARGGAVGVHNSGYWLGRPYLGLGMGAHSMRSARPGVERRRNVRSLARYLDAPTAPDGIDRIGPAEHLGERLFLAARTTLGVAWEELNAPPHVATVWRRLQDDGLLAEDECIIRATPRGLDLADTIAQRFWEAATRP